MLFIPCKKLKYRGILFVGVDFHSENRESINAKRIADALSFVKKLNYSKLSCPEDFLYSPQVQSYRDLFNELNRAIMETKEDEKINFEIEFILKRNLTTYSRYADCEWIFNLEENNYPSPRVNLIKSRNSFRATSTFVSKIFWSTMM